MIRPISASYLFTYELNYNNGPHTAYYNGNISSVIHSTKQDNMLRGYKYTYNHLNQLVHGVSILKTGTDFTVNNYYNESLTYDKNGNITTLNRNTNISNIAHEIDDLTYEYQGNQLLKVSDNSGDPYSASIIQRKGNNTTAFYYLHRDYLGSILAITNSAGAIVEKRHFDAWGNILLVQNGQNNNLDRLTFLERGYTGHEHLQGVGLINMNARLYDPKLHRFLAPDNFIQDPSNSQNYNRYGYVMNNPLKFTDPSGELFIFTIFNAVVETLQNVFTYGINFDNYDYHQTNMSFKIDMGMFHTDSNRKSFWKRVWQLYSRFTWQSPQSILGYLYSNFRNLNDDVDRVEYFGGATFVINEDSKTRDGLSLGNNININIRGSFNQENHSNGWIFGEDGLYWHEYGHTFQSERYGVSYLFAIGIPSAFSAGGNNHDSKSYEFRANRWAWRYANKHGYMDEWLYPVDRPLD